jgi:hypothetical protein
MIGLYEKLCIIIGVMKISVNFKKLKNNKTNNKKNNKKKN